MLARRNTTLARCGRYPGRSVGIVPILPEADEGHVQRGCNAIANLLTVVMNLAVFSALCHQSCDLADVLSADFI